MLCRVARPQRRRQPFTTIRVLPRIELDPDACTPDPAPRDGSGPARADVAEASLFPPIAAAPQGNDVDDVDDVDEVSVSDVDLDRHPLPRVPRTVVALWVVRAVAALVLVLGAALGGAAFGVIGAVVAGIVAAVPTAILGMSRWLVRHGNDEERFLRIERQAHPRFFVVLDEVCADVGAPMQDALYLVNESNSYNACVSGRSTILMGFGAIVAYDRTALRSTLGHELGHHLAGDAVDPGMRAMSELESVVGMPAVVMPPAPLARRLLAWARSDALRRSRLHEHSADFWGGVAAGPGTTATCLMADRRALYLWQGLTDDVSALVEGGFRPHDVYALLQRAVQRADEDGFEMRPSTSHTPTDSTHPGDRSRATHTESQLRHLKARTVDASPALELFDNASAIMADLTALYFDPDSSGAGDWLTVVDDDDLWRRYIEAVRPHVCVGFVTALDPTPSDPMTILLDRVRPLTEAGGRYFAGDTDITARVIGCLLDLLVDEGRLQGSKLFGCQRYVQIRFTEHFRVVLAARLAQGELWDELEAELRRGDAQRQALLATFKHVHGRPWGQSVSLPVNDHRDADDDVDGEAWEERTDTAWEDRTDDVSLLAAE